MDIFSALSAQIEGMDVIDCHEHTFLPEARPSRVDLWTLIQNSDVGDDLISSGMPAEYRSALDWERVSPYIVRVGNTGFYRSLILAFSDLFDFPDPDIRVENWAALSQKIADANTRPDWYSHVLHERGRIRCVLRVQGSEPDPFSVDRRFFAPLINLDEWINAAPDPAQREVVAAKAGGGARSLENYLAALERYFSQAKAGGAVGVKSMLAYRRSLDFSCPDNSSVKALFAKRELAPAEARMIEDFMMHEAARRAGVLGLPYQMHVGYGSWQNNITAGANPLFLNPLIEKQRATKFVLLHGGYPYIGEMGTLAKNHPNVFIETGWLAYIAPQAYERALEEWLDGVPMNKILAFGADCLHIEQTLGALIMTRQLLARTLARKVTEMGWYKSLALDCAARLLAHNARELYGV